MALAGTDFLGTYREVIDHGRQGDFSLWTTVIKCSDPGVLLAVCSPGRVFSCENGRTLSVPLRGDDFPVCCGSLLRNTILVLFLPETASGPIFQNRKISTFLLGVFPWKRRIVLNSHVACGSSMADYETIRVLPGERRLTDRSASNSRPSGGIASVNPVNRTHRHCEISDIPDSSGSLMACFVIASIMNR